VVSSCHPVAIAIVADFSVAIATPCNQPTEALNLSSQGPIAAPSIAQHQLYSLLEPFKFVKSWPERTNWEIVALGV
jgi:hypothetical protein